MSSGLDRSRVQARRPRAGDHGYRRDLTGVLRDENFWAEGNPEAQARVLTELATDPFVASRLAAVEHPKCPPAVLAHRLDDEDQWVACTAALHPALPATAALTRIADAPAAARAAAQDGHRRGRRPASARLRADQVCVLWAIALNTRLPDSVREDAVATVYRHAPHLKARVHETVHDLDRLGLPDGGNVGPGGHGDASWGWWVIERLVRHPDPAVRLVAVGALFKPATVGRHPHFGYRSWRERVLADEDVQVLGRVAEVTTDPAVLDALLSQSPPVTVRRRIAKNASVSSDTITRLLGDVDVQVRRAATDRLSDALSRT